jgi:hypothetical protein
MNSKIYTVTVLLFTLALGVVGCGGSTPPPPPPPPTPDIQATVQAQVQATVAAAGGGGAEMPPPPAPPSTQDEEPTSPSPTVTAEAATATLTPEPTPTLDPNLPSGQWAVRIDQQDDANLIMVNQHIVGATIIDNRDKLDWVTITNLFESGQPNYVTFVNIDKGRPGKWSFALKHNDVVVWGNEGETDQENTLGYLQTVQIFADNSVQPVNLRDFNKEILSGASWSARVKAQDAGVMFINGVPVTGGFSGEEGDLGWVDVSGLFYANQDNLVSVAVWNDSGDYSWDVALRKGETIVWGTENKGSGQAGEVFFTTVIVDGDGNVVR